MPKVRTLSIASSTLVVAALTACGSSGTETTVATSPPVTTSIDSPPPAAEFEGVNPCDLLTSDEVESTIGVAGLTGEWQPNEDATIIGCNWGDGPGSVSAALTVGLDTRFLTVGRTLDSVEGHEVKLEQSDEDSCGLTVEFSNDRRLMLGFVQSAQQVKAEKNPSDEVWCDRTLTLVKAAIPRLGWQ